MGVPLPSCPPLYNAHPDGLLSKQRDRRFLCKKTRARGDPIASAANIPTSRATAATPGGPTLPAFLSPNVAKVLVENFGIAGIGTVDEDLKLFFGEAA